MLKEIMILLKKDKSMICKYEIFIQISWMVLLKFYEVNYKNETNIFYNKLGVLPLYKCVNERTCEEVISDVRAIFKESKKVQTNQQECKSQFNHLCYIFEGIRLQVSQADILKESLELLNNIDFKNDNDIKEISLDYIELLEDCKNTKFKALSLTTNKTIFDFVYDVLLPENEADIYSYDLGLSDHFIELDESECKSKYNKKRISGETNNINSFLVTILICRLSNINSDPIEYYTNYKIRAENKKKFDYITSTRPDLHLDPLNSPLDKLNQDGQGVLVVSNTSLSRELDMITRKHMIEKHNLFAMVYLNKDYFGEEYSESVILFFNKKISFGKIWECKFNSDLNEKNQEIENARSTLREMMSGNFPEVELNEYSRTIEVKNINNNSWSLNSKFIPKHEKMNHEYLGLYENKLMLLEEENKKIENELKELF